MKKFIQAKIAILIFIAMYCTIIFLIFGLGVKKFSATFWTNFIFALLIPVACFVASFFNFKTFKELSFGIYYVKAAFTVALVELLISSIMIGIPMGSYWWISLIIHLFILGISTLIIMKTSVGIQHIENVTREQKKVIDYLNLLYITLVDAQSAIKNSEDQNNLKLLIRKVQNSTGETCSHAMAIESELLQKANALKTATENEQQQLILELNELLIKRNNIVTMLGGR